MILKPEILYSMVIIKFVESNNINKIETLKQIDAIINILSKYNKLITKNTQIDKYNNKNFANQIKKIFCDIKLNPAIKSMFINCNFETLNRVYNILLKKWNLSQINIISSYKISNNNKKSLELQLDNVVKIDYKHDTSLINGDILVVNSLKIDNSALGKLDKLSFELIN